MSTSGGYHEYIGDTMSTSGDIMMHVGEQVDKSLSVSIESPDVLNIPDVLMISPDVLVVYLRCTEHPPMYSWYSSTCIIISPNVLNVLQCTHDIPPMYT